MAKRETKERTQSDAVSKRKKKGFNERCLQNLRPWKPGQSGNPAGYSAKREIQDHLVKILHRIDKEGSTLGQAICEKAVSEALEGSVQHFVAIADRVDGKPRQAIEHSGPGGGSIVHGIADLDAFIEERLQRGRDRALASGGKSGSSGGVAAEATPAGTVEPK